MRSWHKVFTMVVIAIVAGLAWSATAMAQQAKLTASDGAESVNMAHFPGVVL